MDRANTHGTTETSMREDSRSALSMGREERTSQMETSTRAHTSGVSLMAMGNTTGAMVQYLRGTSVWD